MRSEHSTTFSVQGRRPNSGRLPGRGSSITVKKVEVLITTEPWRKHSNDATRLQVCMCTRCLYVQVVRCKRRGRKYRHCSPRQMRYRYTARGLPCTGNSAKQKGFLSNMELRFVTCFRFADLWQAHTSLKDVNGIFVRCVDLDEGSLALAGDTVCTMAHLKEWSQFIMARTSIFAAKQKMRLSPDS
jgi:hypothetical protein